MDLDIETLLRMELGEEQSVGPTTYIRVPGGWLVLVYNGPAAPMCFVPEPIPLEGE